MRNTIWGLGMGSQQNESESSPGCRRTVGRSLWTFEELWIFPMWRTQLLVSNLCRADLTAYFNSTDLSNLDPPSQLLFIYPSKRYYLRAALISLCFLTFRDPCYIWENITSFSQGGQGGLSFSPRFILLDYYHLSMKIPKSKLMLFQKGKGLPVWSCHWVVVTWEMNEAEKLSLMVLYFDI